MAANTQIQRAIMRPDPLLTFRWEVADVPDGESYGVNSSYIEGIEVPFNNVRTTGVFMGGTYKYFPEFHDRSPINVVFYADSEGRALKYLMAWKQQVKDFKSGKYNLPVEFKKDMTLHLLNTRGERVIIVTYIGMWPADTNPVSLDQDGTGRITFSQTFSIDDVEIVM